jgi:uncharacterized membrane protein YfhO
VALPTFLMVALLQVATERFEILPLLLISNYLDPDTLQGFTFYFMEIYIQLLVLAAVLFSLPAARSAFRDHPMFSALVLLLMTVVLRQSIEAVWDGTYNFHRTPWNYGWAFALGIVLAVAKVGKAGVDHVVGVGFGADRVPDRQRRSRRWRDGRGSCSRAS